MTDPPHSPSAPQVARAAWWREWEIAVLVALVLAAYFARITALPVCGEESRWATTAREMIASGDWIVPCQQGVVFPERPPLGSWAMALVGLARDRVDLASVRLPSATAILLLTLLIYLYARDWMSRLGAFASAMFFATGAQVLQIGRLGESEAIFTLFTGGALLAWHWGQQRRWPAGLAWIVGYALAALGALCKGPQAPIYFVVVTSAYLAWRRDWRNLFSLGHVAGLAAFGVIVGLWLIPFAQTNWQWVDDIWAGLAQDRFAARGLLKHLAGYPVETLGCLLPWSPILFLYFLPSVRRTILAERPAAAFLIVAVLVTYPSVLFASAARGRYYMPLYPCLAVLMGLAVEHVSTAAASIHARVAWRRYLRVVSAVSLAGCVALTVIHFLPGEKLADARQSWPFLTLWIVVSLSAAAGLAWASRSESFPRPQVAIVLAGSLISLTYAGLLVNSRVHAANDLSGAVRQLAESLPDADQLVSLGRVYHRFAYCYEKPIRQVPWPIKAEDLPADVTYFCFDRRIGDSDWERSTDDGRLSYHVPGKLPFEWETVAEIPADPMKRSSQNDRTIIIGRRRPIETAHATSDTLVR